jgi:hypothetical protein
MMLDTPIHHACCATRIDTSSEWRAFVDAALIAARAAQSQRLARHRPAPATTALLVAEARHPSTSLQWTALGVWQAAFLEIAATAHIRTQPYVDALEAACEHAAAHKDADALEQQHEHVSAAVLWSFVRLAHRALL